MTTEMTIQKQANPVIALAHTFEVVTAEDAKKATEMLSKLNKVQDAITEEKEKVLAPLREAEKAERGRWKATEDQIKPAILSLRSKLSVYQTESIKLANQAKAALFNRVGSGKGKLKATTAITKAAEIQMADEAIATDTGTIKFRTSYRIKVTDENKIPREFLMIDEKKLLAHLKTVKSVAGAELEEIQTPINFR